MRKLAASACLALLAMSAPLTVMAQTTPWDENVRATVVRVVQRTAAAVDAQPSPRTPNDEPSDVTAVPDLPAAWFNGTTMGDPNAPVIVQVWEDFLCPSCRGWSATIEPQVVEEYVKPGLVRLEIHHFPLSMHSPGAEMGAQASLCANDQELFWPYRQRLFAAQDDGQAGFTTDALVRYADELGLDRTAFEECMNNQTYQDEVAESVNEALSIGLNFVTSIIVNGEWMNDSFDYETEMKNLMDRALSGEE